MENIHLTNYLAELKLSPIDLKQRNLNIYSEAQIDDLVVAELDRDGRTLVLKQSASLAWRKMQESITADGLSLFGYSGFRSYKYQMILVKKAMAQGRSLDEVLSQLAPPGTSEHHTGRAVDLGTNGCPLLSEEFDQTETFHWLKNKAKNFGFVMSFPKDNPQGFIYEPWHWCFNEVE